MSRRRTLRAGSPSRTPRKLASMSPAIRLHLLPDAPNADGLPRAGLEMPPAPGRRPLLMLFPSVAAAVAAKAAMEARHG